MISNFGLFNVEEAKPAVSVRDPYDSWPFIAVKLRMTLLKLKTREIAALNYGKF